MLVAPDEVGRAVERHYALDRRVRALVSSQQSQVATGGSTDQRDRSAIETKSVGVRSQVCDRRIHIPQLHWMMVQWRQTVRDRGNSVALLHEHVIEAGQLSRMTTAPASAVNHDHERCATSRWF